ncbi:MAG: hypothetical protein ACYDCK_14470, partial [Thermoplasmatota archaeon]
TALAALPLASARADTMLLSGDGGDVPAPIPGALDLVSLAAHEGSDYPGVVFIVKVANVADVPPSGVAYIVRGTLAGKSIDFPFRIYPLVTPPTSPTECESTCTVDAAASSVRIGAPYASSEFPLKPGDDITDIFVESFTGEPVGVGVDVMPGAHPPQAMDRPTGPHYVVQGPPVVAPAAPVAPAKTNATNETANATHATNATSSAASPSPTPASASPEHVAQASVNATPVAAARRTPIGFAPLVAAVALAAFIRTRAR